MNSSQVRSQALAPEFTIEGVPIQSWLRFGMSSELSLTDFAKEKQFFIEPKVGGGGLIHAPVRVASWRSKQALDGRHESQIGRLVSASPIESRSFSSITSQPLWQSGILLLRVLIVLGSVFCTKALSFLTKLRRWVTRDTGPRKGKNA